MAQSFSYKTVHMADVVSLIDGSETGMTDEELTTEIQRRIQEGKEALENHEIENAFDLLFAPALVDDHAKRLLLMSLSRCCRVRLITEDQIEQNKVEDMAEKGYAMAQYVMGRYHQLVKPNKNSIEKAMDWYDKAKAAGIGDAFACEAEMVMDGYYHHVDFDLYNRLLREGLEQGYSKDHCSMSLFRTLHTKINGNYGVTANPQGVIDSVMEIIGTDESDDLDEVDPCYYRLLGNAYEELGDKGSAIKYYCKAVDMGYYECYSTCILLSAPDEDSTHEVWQTWRDMCLEGCDLGDPMCYLLYGYCYEIDYNDLPEDEKPKRTEEMKKYLTCAYALGDEFGAYLLGTNYYYGKNGFEENHDWAWEWLDKAAYWEDGWAYSMLALMIDEGYDPDTYDKTWAEDFRLQALRRGVNDELEAVVNIYRSGRWTDYAKEIELLYIPKYEQQQAEGSEEDEDSEDEEEYDDLKLIAIIKTDGTADIIEFDVEYWDELPPFVDAKGLDAIRVQPLYDISKRLGYEEHITGWVDNMGLLRNLPMNPIGCDIYPGPIAGDMILTLEDTKYKPMSFTNLKDLKKVIADLGAKLVTVNLDDGPDDDGRYDAWS